MPRKQSRAATIVEAAIDSIEEATAAVGSKVHHGLSDAATAVAKSSLVERVEKQAKTSRKAIAKNVAKAKRVAKKQVAKATKKMAATKKAAKKRVVKATKKAPTTKKAPQEGPGQEGPGGEEGPDHEEGPGHEEASRHGHQKVARGQEGPGHQEGLGDQVADNAASRQHSLRPTVVVHSNHALTTVRSIRWAS